MVGGEKLHWKITSGDVLSYVLPGTRYMSIFPACNVFVNNTDFCRCCFGYFFFVFDGGGIAAAAVAAVEVVAADFVFF